MSKPSFSQPDQNTILSLPFNISSLEYPEYARKYKQKDVVNFCENLLRDLKANKNVQFLKPELHVETSEELSKSNRFGNCAVSEFISSVTYEPRIWESIKNLPIEERKNYGTTWTMTKTFLMFKADIDNNPKNGIENIIYGAGSTSNRHKKADFTYFVVPNLKSCSSTYKAQVYDIVHHQDSTVGILRHNGKHLLYDTKRYNNEKLHSIGFKRLTYVPKRGNSLFFSVCSFIAKDKEPNKTLQPTPKSGASEL